MLRMWSSGSVVPSYWSSTSGFSIPRGRWALWILPDRGLRKSSSLLGPGEVECLPHRGLPCSLSGLVRLSRGGRSLGFGTALEGPRRFCSGERLLASVASGLWFFLLFLGG